MRWSFGRVVAVAFITLMSMLFASGLAGIAEVTGLNLIWQKAVALCVFMASFFVQCDYLGKRWAHEDFPEDD